MSKTTGRLTQEDVEIVSQDTVYQGFFKVHKVQLRHSLFVGGKSDLLVREIVDRGDAVAIIPYDSAQDRLVLIEQFRAGLVELEQHKPTQQSLQSDFQTKNPVVQSPWILEFPAGMVAPEENVTEVAARELYEETGLQAKHVKEVLQYYSSPGGMTEKITLCIAEVDASQAQEYAGLRSEHEDIRVVQLKTSKVFELLAQGVINNAATVIGLQWFALQKLQGQ